MSRFGGGHTSSGLVGAASLVNNLNPLAVGQAMEQFQRVQQNNQQREIFNNLLQQHQSDFQNDTQYRKYFNAQVKRNPNALMDARNLSQTVSNVGSIREQMNSVAEIEQRISSFAQTPQGQAISFNSQFELQELKRIAAVIQQDPELGSQMLMQKMNVLSAAMQNGQRETAIQAFFKSVDGLPLNEQLQALDNSKGIEFQDRLRIQKALADRVAAQPTGGFTAKDFGTPTFRELRGEAENVSNETQLNDFTKKAAEALKRGEVTRTEFDAIEGGAKGSLKNKQEIEKVFQAEQAITNNVELAIDRMAEQDIEATAEGFTEFIADEENQKFLLQGTGFNSLGEARAKIDNLDEIIQQRFLQSIQREASNVDTLERFAQRGGNTADEGVTIVQPSTTIDGVLTFPTEGGDSLLIKKVPPAAQIAEGTFFDDRGLPGVSELNMIETKLPDPETGEMSDVTVAAFGASPSRVTQAGDQIGLAFSDVNSPPFIFRVPVVNGQLDQSKREQLDGPKFGQYIQEMAANIQADKKLPLLMKSLEAARDAVRNEKLNATKGGQQEFDLGIIENNLQNRLDSMSAVSEDVSFSGGTVSRSTSREAIEATGLDERRLIEAALLGLYTEYGRYMTARTNAYVGPQQEGNRARAQIQGNVQQVVDTLQQGGAGGNP